MKLYISVILFIGIISCLCVAAPATDDDGDDGGTSGRGLKVDLHECTGQYLKSKGKLFTDVPTGNSRPEMCHALLRDVVPGARVRFENKAKEILPNEVVCLMTEFDKGEVADFIIEVVFYKTYESFSATEKKIYYASIETVGHNLLNTMASACGIEKERFDAFVEHGVSYLSISKRAKAPETDKSN